MIRLNKNLLDNYTPADFFTPGGDYIGTTNNEIIFNDFRVQIKKEQITGYYMMYKGEKITFDRNGTPSDFPEFTDVNTKNLLELI